MLKKIRYVTGLVVLMLLISGNLLAQNSFEIGLKINPEFTTLYNTNDKNAGAELDYAQHFGYYSFGVGAVYNFNEYIGVAVDILFSREGQAFTGNISNSVDNSAYSSEVVLQSSLVGVTMQGQYKAFAELNFIKLPLMLSLSTDRTKNLFFNCLLGPQINFLEGVAQEVNDEDHFYPGTNIKPIDLYKSLTLNCMLALGAGFNVSSHLVLVAHLRFDYGFSDIEKKDVKISYLGLNPVNFYDASRGSTHNATAGLMIGINYKL